jgi:hypothetical protein
VRSSKRWFRIDHPLAPCNLELDPEDGLRIIHSMFHFLGCHRTREGFADNQNARHISCPFFTCCKLDLRKANPDICKKTPWEAADWSGWDTEKGACWYGTAVRITRPPAA